jgi:hypothetical protein
MILTQYKIRNSRGVEGTAKNMEPSQFIIAFFERIVGPTPTYQNHKQIKNNHFDSLTKQDLHRDTTACYAHGRG